MGWLKKIFAGKNTKSSKEPFERNDGTLERKLQQLEDEGQGLGPVLALLEGVGVNPAEIMTKLDREGVSKERIIREMIDYLENSGTTLSAIFKEAAKQGHSVQDFIFVLSAAGVPQAKITKAYADSGLVTDSKSPETYESIKNMAQKGEYDEVIRLTTEAIDSGEIDTNSLSMYYDLRANAYRDKGMIDKAIEDIEFVKHLVTSQFPPGAQDHPAVKNVIKQVDMKLAKLRAKRT